MPSWIGSILVLIIILFVTIPHNVCVVTTGKGSEASLPKELSSLTERVKALEGNSELLDKNSEGTKILTEISQKLEMLSHLAMASA